MGGQASSSAAAEDGKLGATNGGGPDAPSSASAEANHDAKYDTQVKTTTDTSTSWLFGGGKPKSASEIRDERYCGYLSSLNKVLTDWSTGTLKNQEALMHADYYMEKIQEVGRVDADRAREMLAAKGIDDQRRMDLQREYQDLKRKCGQKVPQFDDKGMHTAGQPWHKACC